MRRFFKFFLYIIACAVLFFALVKTYNGSLSPNSVNAFEWEKRVNIYLGNENMGSSEDCSKVFPVVRTVLNAETLGPGTIEMLLKGVSEEERKSGYFTSINDGALLQRFEIKNKIAYVDFDSRFNEGMAGSCRVTAIRSQIENTLINLPDIESVIISVNGQTEGILEP